MTADISGLIADLSAPDDAARIAAAEQLQNRPDAVAAAVPLVHATGDANEQVREYATSALEDMAPPAEEDIATIMGLLGNSSPEVAYWAATLLGRCGSKAAASVEPLAATMLGAEAATVRQRAAWALGEMGAQAGPARSALEQAAQSDDRRLARFATAALGKL